jgi:predicted Fe-S protein YdhL (DUF1289 family)
MNVASPCIKICQLDAGGICIGCHRSMQEIAAWASASDEEKRSILQQVAQRAASAANAAGTEQS